MKNNILKLTLALLVVFSYTSCEEDLVIYDADGGQTGLSFARASQTIEFCAGSGTVTVESTTRTNADRTISINVNSDLTSAMAGEYTVANSVTIPAGEFVGSTPIDVDFSAIPEGSSRVLALDVVAPDGTVINTRGTTQISFSSACTLNEVKFDFVFDNYPEETAWQLYDADSGDFIDGDTGFGNYDDLETFSVTLCIPDGNYDFVVFDQFGDGICCAYGNGSINGNLIACDGNSSLFDQIDEFGGQIVRSFSVGN
ncbi:hypothetical protein [Psychroserpens luteolus]|uniref:hypothetical protein n=1 Tax=Psychroserpens luteolus TaxID=2855840 RepID=UPI001E413FD6|nr:hypothetical protein [Psychroserpens luteolus]MCD2260065.1 hypothetical protein [Psychroserpens luteolus]